MGSFVGIGEGALVGAFVSGDLVGFPCLTVGISVGPGLGWAVVGAGVDGREEGVLVGEAVVGDGVVGACVGLAVVGNELGIFVGLEVIG